MQSRRALIAAAVLFVAAVALLAAGCGGGGKSPSVASLGSSAAGTTTSDSGGGSPAPSGGTANGGARSGFGLTLKTQNGAKYAACMRAHGVPNFPDPNSQGAITIGPSSGIDPASPKFRNAQQTCQKLLPNGGQPSPAQLAAMQQKMLAYSACMRKNGLHDFPDPSFSGGGVTLRLRGGPGSDLDPTSPAFQKAQQACQADLPGKVGGTTAGGK